MPSQKYNNQPIETLLITLVLWSPQKMALKPTLFITCHKIIDVYTNSIIKVAHGYEFLGISLVLS